MQKSKFLLLIFAGALVLRLSLIFVAYHGDLNNNISWGTLAVERGLSGFYESGHLPSGALREGGWPYSAPNQPPLSILLFASTRVVWQTVENAAWWLNNNFELFYSPFIWFWENRGMTLLVKLPSILADLGIAWVIYQYMKQKQKEKLGLGLSALWLFNPVSWYNSSVWGQTDALVNLLGLAGIFYLLQKKLVPFTLFYILSLLFKGSLLIFGPVLFFVAVWQKYKTVDWIRAGVVALLVVVGVSVWFHPAADLLPWLASLYQNRILPGEIGFLTANAFNFWWLVDPGRVLDSTLYLELPARTWGFLLTLPLIGVLILWIRKKPSKRRIIIALVLTSLVSFLFLTRVHERYLYPFFPLATLSLSFLPQAWFLYAVLSVTHILNLYHLFWAPANDTFILLYSTPWFINLLVLTNLFSFGLFAWLVFVRKQSRV